MADFTRLPHTALDTFDDRVARFMRRHGVRLLRYAVGVVFVWFGALKLVPGLSPAEALVKATVPFVDADLFYPVLAVWEILIGVMLVAESIGTPIAKGYIYFAMAFALIVQFLNMRMQTNARAKSASS